MLPDVADIAQCTSDELDLLALGTFTGPAGTFRRPPNSPRPSTISSPGSRSRPEVDHRGHPATP